MDKIDLKEGWRVFNDKGIIESDTLLLAMLQEVVDTIHSLERMYPNGHARLVVVGLFPTYQSLSSMAFHRNLDYVSI